MYQDLRNKYKLTQPELAKNLGVYQSAISKVETGETKPSFYSLKRIYELYGIEEVEHIFKLK